VPLSEAIVSTIRPVLLVLLGGAGLLLLIAAVNVTSLLLVRAESRRAEISVRHALGAARGRLVRQFLTEGLLLAAASGALGLAFAAGAVPLLLRLVPAGMKDGMPFLRGLGLNGHVLAFAGAVSVFGALLFTLAPYVRLPGRSVRAGLAGVVSTPNFCFLWPG
jgi:ABC-type antimicrobial peptide transport system permease subunit